MPKLKSTRVPPIRHCHHCGATVVTAVVRPPATAEPAADHRYVYLYCADGCGWNQQWQETGPDQ